ncbi:class I SAM-dependent methyltransferase [Saccharothrix sp. NPDC042600]|uniref:class I SAM-dependent methyltransferase n=1 Tax=Saccharothrix TaxID=2071 RepID=UPI0033D42E6E|nr:class I SAM-dependent methyltransferase [Saccharothrix mutabilis subsp. capreolus]
MGNFDHNAHYHPLLLAQVPPGARTALDVGCGNGRFARQLAARGLRVTGVDKAVEAVVPGVEVRRADAVVDDLGGPYDFVSCIAALHHMPFTTAITRLRDAVAPGGVLAVLGLAKEKTAWDWVVSLASVPADLARKAVVDDPVDTAPVRDWHMSVDEVKAGVADLLPGARVRRHLYWRYSLVWRERAAGTAFDQH